MKTAMPQFLTAVVIVCLVSVQNAQAVSPPPDGGYPGQNTAEGQNALLDLNVNNGTNNTAVGWLALRTNVDGDFNTAIGSAALATNTGDGNTAIGGAALFSNTTGDYNMAAGLLALFHNTAGVYNTALGASTLQSNHQGISNTAAGYQALYVNDSSGTGLGSYNSAFGAFALTNNDDGEANCAFGTGAMEFNSSGLDNVAVGTDSLSSNTIGVGNTAVGTDALESSTGSDNLALGAFAGINQTTGSANVYIGAHMAGVAGESNACYIASIFGQTSATGIPVLINSDNKLGTTTSSKRFKEKISPMERASGMLYALKPVTFRYKKEIDPSSTLQFGLVAEEVEKVNPDLVVRDKEGKPYSVRYDQVNAMLLNEFLKAHCKIEEQEATIAQLKAGAAKQEAINAEQRKGMEVLTAMVKQQAAQIQKVSAQVELNTPASQTVVNTQ
jgi:Chaperone of endosialidase